NIFYYARKDSINTDYISEVAIDPTLPNLLIDPEHLLIRIDQLDPVTGLIKTLPITTSPIATLDYLDHQKLINQVFEFDSTGISSTINPSPFDSGVFKLGNIRYVFESQAQSFTSVDPGAYYLYWSNYDLIRSSVELTNKVLLGTMVANGLTGIVFNPVTLGLTYLNEANMTLAPTTIATFTHGFNTKDLSVQVWLREDDEVFQTSGLKVSKIGLNQIKIQNTSTESVLIDHLLIR